MIKNSDPISIPEVMEYVKEDEAKKDLIGFLKKFSELKSKDAKELKRALEELKAAKLKQDYLVKIIEILPETPAELNKIFVDVTLDEDEAKKIIDTVKKFK